jgi:hypothetical protein
MDKFRKSVGFQINFILYSGLDASTAIEHICSAAETLINNARVQQTDDARVEEIRERWSNVPTMSVGIWEGGDSLYEEQEPHRTIGYLHKQVDRDHAIALSKSKSDVDYLLSLLPQLSSSGPCVCGHAKSEHELLSDHDECLGCRGLDEPCSEFRAIIVPVESAPAGVEGGAVAWLLPHIKRRLQTVLDCENGMCTHCCEVLAGDLAPMIDHAIELCAAPVATESEEAEPLNGSEDSWMTL